MAILLFLFWFINVWRSAKLSYTNKYISLPTNFTSSPLISYILGDMNLVPLLDFVSTSNELIVGTAVNVSKGEIFVNKLSLNLFRDPASFLAVFDFILKF